ncbi:Extracellular exo-alpha-L-arabinofuranosidase pre cursor [Bifidobacterium pseudocatenulatum]|uniref:Extracellular exo-alpha-L-arabinofuranosidase pre cursor n=1 Tax=Bifidobacterium pseudocatenulatum TaxID=28026 RepID=A0ABY6YDF4_BIFPS|nr:RICIN domain-containing protein [Bifidobacterium pseudocatenulatum]CAG9066028.1 Extracellular exo-alpha-L-arabinofuranosidase pre cursor [Bifidobacterium pseudocatenulatum]CAG9076760.1 Extracellular exo-alpha-L-arabinofuranosidase pre cursor [Bifidobacterium pseudocatenulatum]VWQ23126.1 Extracellular exo-alpha-L-arabinofuranosidase pre cursor [Bifidobacterium pseudocatenulatum]VWQ24961.1 Extracellular exo-alpha-L-arabinofuranosidase pre cursor [Bifidobacterium pseudocatenulatum]VWQ25020.1 E
MVSPHHVVKIATALSAVALAASVAVAPAYALQDIAIEDAVAQSGSVTADNGVVMQSDDQSDDQTGDQQSQDSMPDNPNAKLPDNVSDEISDDATVISEDLAVTPEGEVKNIETGEIVTDPTLVGTKDQQPDPLAKTNGESFIPVSAEDVKNAVVDANVQLSKFESNEYGAHWGTYNNTKAFFDYQNNLFVQQAKGVIDVSGWQGDIDWAKAKADGVEGAIIRLGYGEGNNADKKAQRNISECKRLGIPFGIYWYSYADTPALAKEEGTDVVAKLKQFGVNPSDLAYPVYYDLEKWTWEGHQPPTDPNVYNNIVNNWYSALQSAGYKNLGVYSYTSYLQGPLKHADIYAKTTWVAQYGARMGFDSFPTNSRGWQYTSTGKVDGISGNVDMNAFGNKAYVNGGSSNDLQAAIDVRKMTAVTIPNGNYYINVRSKVASSVDIPGGSAADSTAIQLYSGNGSKAQQFTFTRQSDGSYEIVNVNSGKALDVRNGVAENNAIVQQYSRNNSQPQRWFIRDSGAGYYLQSVLGNWVLDLSGGNTANGAAIRLYMPNGTASQLFVVSSSDVNIATGVSMIITSVANKKLVTDVAGASTANGARVQLYSSNNTNAQKYRFESIGNGTYKIVNINSGKMLDVAGGSTANGAALQQYTSNNTVAQQWTVRNYGSGKIALVSVNANKAVDIPGGNAVQQAQLQLYSPNGTVAQQWLVAKAPLTLRERLNETAAKHRQDLPDGTYTFGSKLNTSMKMDVSGASRSNYGNVQIWAGNGTNAQKWKVMHDSNGYVTLTSVNSGKVLDVNGGVSANGTNVQQYDSNGTYAQKWIAVKNSDGSYTFQSALAENAVLDVNGGSSANGTNVQLYTSNGTNAQKWVK